MSLCFNTEYTLTWPRIIPHTWRNLGGSYCDIEGSCKAATLAEVAANNYVLSPGRYVGYEAEEDDGVPFEEKMKLLTIELAAQFEESALLEKRIRENLEGIGFGGNILFKSIPALRNIRKFI